MTKVNFYLALSDSPKDKESKTKMLLDLLDKFDIIETTYIIFDDFNLIENSTLETDIKDNILNIIVSSISKNTAKEIIEKYGNEKSIKITYSTKKLILKGDSLQ